MPDVTFPSIHYVTIVPHLIVTGLACILMVLDAITKRSRVARVGQMASVLSISRLRRGPRQPALHVRSPADYR